MSIQNGIVIVRAPFRVSLAGGGTDLASYADRFGGEVLGISINRYVVSSIISPHYSEHSWWRGECQERYSRIEDIESPYIRAIFQGLGKSVPVNVVVISEAPPGSGLGGSAAFLNSITLALRTINGLDTEKAALAMETSRVEIKTLNRNVGTQDHHLSALGGCNHLCIGPDSHTTYESLDIGPRCREYFEHNLLLFYTNTLRSASTTLNTLENKISSDQDDTVETMHKVKQLVQSVRKAIEDDVPGDIGPLVQAHWDIKSRLYTQVSNAHIDSLIDTACRSGADGVKILGAGGGGYLLVSTRDDTRHKVRQALLHCGMKELLFRMDEQGACVVSSTEPG